MSIVDNADTANKGNKKSRQINGLVNEWYLEDMSDNIRSVLTSRRQNGFHIGAFALYGYKKDPERKGHLLIDEEAACVVREVFTLFSQGYGKTAIARILNDRGVPNPTEYKRLHGLRYQQPKGKTSALWKYFAISDMLVNEMYIGNMVQGKYGSVSYKTKQNRPRPRSQWYIVEGTHEAIIDRELWDTVQALIAERAKPFSTGETGLFARKARCRGCGAAMRSRKMSDGRRYLCCASRYVSKDACEGAFISVAKLEQAVLEELRLLCAAYLDRDELEERVEFQTHLAAQKKRLEDDMASCRKKADEYAACIRRLYVDKVRAVISERQYLDFSREFSDEKRRCETLVSVYERKLADIERKTEAGDNRRALIEEYMHPGKLDRETVDKMIEYISIGGRSPGTDETPVEIYWNV